MGLVSHIQRISVAVERHATSKLNSAQDLFNISTLGFRGEALASIGSVSRFHLTSRSQEADVGARLIVEGGQGIKVELIGAPGGTVARVENLFFNVPARLKFLKSDSTERSQIDNLVTRYALAYPQVRFHLNKKPDLLSKRVEMETAEKCWQPCTGWILPANARSPIYR
jgi:DNA mismatch repair protein MutL